MGCELPRSVVLTMTMYKFGMNILYSLSYLINEVAKYDVLYSVTI